MNEWNENNNNYTEWSDIEEIDITETFIIIDTKTKSKKSSFLECIEIEEQKEKQKLIQQIDLDILIQESRIIEYEQYNYLDYTFRQLCFIQITIGPYFRNKQQIIIGDIIAGYLVIPQNIITFDEHQYLKELWTHCNVPDIDIWYTNKYEEELIYLIQKCGKKRNELEETLKNGFKTIHNIVVSLSNIEILCMKQELRKIRSTESIQELSIFERGIHMIEKRRMWGVDSYFY